MPTATASRPAIPDWGAPYAAAPSLAVPLSLLVVPTLVAGLLLALLASPLVGSALVLFAAVGVVAYLAGAGGRWLRRLEARPAGDPEARIVNLCTGLASDLGMPPPAVWVIEDAAPNSFAVWHRGPNVGVTSGLIGTFARTEAEAAVTHRLIQLREEGATPTYLVALGTLGLPAGAGDPSRFDARTAAVTRYPPAVASALEKAVPAGGKDSPLWFVGRDVGPESIAARAEALRDL